MLFQVTQTLLSRLPIFTDFIDGHKRQRRKYNSHSIRVIYACSVMSGENIHSVHSGRINNSTMSEESEHLSKCLVHQFYVHVWSNSDLFFLILIANGSSCPLINYRGAKLLWFYVRRRTLKSLASLSINYCFRLSVFKLLWCTTWH